MKLKLIIIVVSTVVISGVLGWVVVNKSLGKTPGIISPLAQGYEERSGQYKFMFEHKTTTVYPPNDFFPRNLLPKYSDDLGLTAKGYAVMDRNTRELLLSKNLTHEVPIASVAKIMTAIVVLEKSKKDQELTVSESAAKIGEASMGLTGGEQVPVEELLYGLLLPSGNDAAETLAQGLDGRVEFIISMNEKAKALGMFDTYFFNPTGLDGETLSQTSFSTPLDLLALSNYALESPIFANIVSTYYKEFPYREGKHKAYFLYNILQLDRAYPGIKGVKPGVTDFAGETLVSYAENGGKHVIVVILGSRQSRDDVVKIYDYIFPKLGVKIPGR